MIVISASDSDRLRLVEGARRFLFTELRRPDCVCLTDDGIVDGGTAMNVPLLQDVKIEMGIG